MAIGILLTPKSVPDSVGHENPLPVGTDYTVVVEYDENNNPIYVGEAIPGSLVSEAKWRIKKITWDVSGNPTNVRWADGVKTFTKVWNSRGDYTYS